MIPNATATEVIDKVTLRGSATTYFALLSADIDVNTTLATMAEITTAGYVRKAAAWSAPSGDPLVSTNSAEVQWTFTADAAVPIVAIALVSAASGTVGTIRRTWSLHSELAPKNGDTITLSVNALSLGAL